MKNKGIFLLPLCCVLLSAILILTSLGLPRKAEFVSHSAELSTLNDAWNLTINGADKGPFTLPGHTGAKAGDVVVLERAMPDQDLTRTYLCFRTSQFYVRAYIDGALIYSYGDPETLPYGKAPGSVWNIVNLSSGGERLQLVFFRDYDYQTGSLGEVLIGSRYSLFYALIQMHFIPVLISVVTMLCGILLVLVGLYLLRVRRATAMFHLGVFCLTASVWCLMESNALDFLIPYPFFVTQLGYLCLMLCPIPMMFFLRGFFDLYSDRLCSGLILGGCALFCVSALLQLLGVLDLFVLIYGGYFFIVVCAVYFFIVMVRKRAQLDRINGVLFRSAVAAIAVFTVADLVTYVLVWRGIVEDRQDLAYFFRIGFLFFILLLAAVCVRQIFAGYMRGIETDVFKRMLQTDLMTGLSSRHIFDLDMESFRRVPPGAHLAMIMFDLNNLKQVNDTLGHKKGDDLIQATAALIRRVFAAHGECYRIGGDEFVAILPEIDRDLLFALISEFNTFAAERGESGVVVDVAVGYGFYNEEIDTNISGLFTRVDDAMYHNKRLRKESGQSGAATETTGRRSTDLHEEPPE